MYSYHQTWSGICLLILTGCSILAPSTFGQSQETPILLQLNTTSVTQLNTTSVMQFSTNSVMEFSLTSVMEFSLTSAMSQVPESSYITRIMVTDDSEHTTSRPTTLSTLHTPVFYPSTLSVVPSLPNPTFTAMFEGERHSESVVFISYSTTAAFEGGRDSQSVVTSLFIPNPTFTAMFDEDRHSESVVSNLYIPHPSFTAVFEGEINSFSFTAVFEGEINSFSVAASSKAVSRTSGGKSSVGMGSKIVPTELKITTTTTTTKAITVQVPEGSRSVTVVQGSPVNLPPPGGRPPIGRPTGPPVASTDHTDIFVSMSVIIAVLVIISGIGIVTLVIVYKYRAARRRVADAVEEAELPRMKKRRNTPWHLYYAEPV